MIFNSFEFIWLFPLIFISYWFFDRISLNGRRFSNIVLLLISYGLYFHYNPAYTLILLGVTVTTYFSARFLESKKSILPDQAQSIDCQVVMGGGKSLNPTDKLSKKRIIVCAGIVLALLPLLVFKYYNFITQIGASALSWIGIDSAPAGLNWAVPLGLSFYTFQAIGYLCDVYDNKISCEKNWWDYMLFVSFFPQILCGPISKASDLLPQIKAKRRFNYSQAVDGCKYLLWGMTLKVCVADRLCIYVDSIYADYSIHSSYTLMLASIAYSFQIYTDFAGYSFMALGTGKLLGYDLIANFNRPYLASSVTEFWKKWNISLTQWLTAHIYIPLGGNRKGKVRTYVNIIITFLVSGIWHGANWTFIFWGMIHGIAQCIEKLFGWNNRVHGTSKLIFKTLITFLIVNFAWIYFRMPTITEGNGVIRRICSMKGSGVELPTEENLIGVLVAITILLVFDFAPHRESPLPKLFTCSNLTKRRVAYLSIMLAILIFGIFESGAFIYLQF